MRTVEQIKKELESARIEEAKCKKTVQRLEQEMKEIYLAARAALGIDEPDMSSSAQCLRQRNSVVYDSEVFDQR